MKLLLSQLPGRFCAPRSIEPSGSMMPGQPMPMKGASLRPSFSARAISFSQHLDEPLDGLLARRSLLVAVPPQLELPDRGLGQVGAPSCRFSSTTPARMLVPPISTARMASWPLNIHAGARCTAPIRPASSGSLRIGTRSIVDVVGLEDDRGAADRQLADAARAKAAADHDALGVAPGLELEEAADDQRELLGEILDRALHDAGRFRVALGQQLVELLLADVSSLGLLAERIVAVLAQRLAPVLEDVAERALAGAVAEEALVVLDFQIVAVDLDRRQASAAVDRQIRQRIVV